MTSEPEEAEVSGVVSAVAAAQSTGEAGTLLEVTFQRNPRQKYKYLEAEPKILGVTEIALTVFFVVGRIPFYIGISGLILNSLMLAFSCVGIISGAVAVAAQNLHLRTLKACLGMQVVTCVAYTFCLMGTSVELDPHLIGCWHHNDSEITHENDTCIQLEKGFDLLYSLDELTEVTQIVLSVTLAAYCCKVIPCCTPRSHVPVIVMTPPTTPQ
ncbi:uncharacterized protein LOC107679252 [Sinocyclocheilus anshuiensis]|uniref:uncharacterized protein LOC107679252 n=1 Tax=Sinocyclocheilus anshuiensis TaxID=1608454 RepID=UPI0007B8B2A8|nr:PREDICTED: uncharacterized protein LOC107679252 [Sinocyclocheilus anshuiensis]